MGFNTHSKYYEQRSHWEKNFEDIPAERERLLATISLIPQGVASILDVGCGNGAFLHALSTDYKRVGTDSSQEALKKVNTMSAQGNIAALPFADRSFDLVSCLEVLEHLPHDTFADALTEITRVAKKYVIVSVPNEQNLDVSLVTCPTCRCRFNPTYHVRSFSPSSLRSLFPKLKPLQIMEIGPVDSSPTYSRAVVAAYQTLIDDSIPEYAVCPQCGYQEGKSVYTGESVDPEKGVQRGRIVRTALWPFRMVSRVIWPPRKRHRWIVALYAATSI